jgi:hypothetical protein
MEDQQKYFSEASLLQATRTVMLMKPAELDRVKRSPEGLKAMEESHVYFVCQRPRVRIAAGNTRKKDGIRLTLNIATNKGTVDKEFVVPNDTLRPDMTAAMPHKNGAYFSFTDGRDDVTPLMPPESLLPVASGQLPELARLEVVYIGQAYGESGARSAADRLKSHSTLQKVLADQAHTSWWMEPVLLLFVYDYPQIVWKTDGRGTPAITGDADESHYTSIMDEPLSEAQLVTIAEASLIRYFKPHYNTHFVGNYPTSDLQHLRDAYRLDYNGLITEIDTEGVYVSTFSKHQKAREHHIAQFDLHDPRERFSFFEILPSPKEQARER